MKQLVMGMIMLSVSTAWAQTPLIDGVFPTASEDADSNLILVRERYDPVKRIQSIYLRVEDGTPDYDVTNGEIFVRGAEIITILTERTELKNSDVNWAIPGVDYGRLRGLDGPDPMTMFPVEDSEFDYATIRQDSVRFWFGTGSDIDDMRILIRYPEENASAYLSPVLYHRRGPDPEPITADFPGSDDPGYQVGGVDDITADDGLYDIAFSIDAVKLKVEDFDVVEDEIDIGTINYVGGAVGPGILTVENGFRGLDPDDDNGVDRNGNIEPIPTTGRIDHLRYRVQALIGPEGASIPTSGIQVLGLPRVVNDGERVFGRISVDCPAHLPEGRYSGSLTLWEDNDGDGQLGPTEPSDSVTLVVVVQDRVDAAVDASTEDMGPVDMTIDAMPDPDIGMRIDLSIDMGGGDVALDMRSVDGSTVSDAALNDARATNDSSIDAMILDTGGADTSTQSTDMAPSDSSGADAEAADFALLDASGDFDKEWPSLPQGGAFHCQVAATSPLYTLILFALVLGLRRRR